MMKTSRTLVYVDRRRWLLGLVANLRDWGIGFHIHKMSGSLLFAIDVLFLHLEVIRWDTLREEYDYG